jgi:addiction module RelB/DinJ family antitoxin
MESRLSVRVDEKVKREAEVVFQQLGLNLSAGINLYLSRVAAMKGIPFPLMLDRETVLGEDAAAFEKRAVGAVRAAIGHSVSNGAPVALFDPILKRPYLQYPNGDKQYDIE